MNMVATMVARFAASLPLIASALTAKAQQHAAPAAMTKPVVPAPIPR